MSQYGELKGEALEALREVAALAEDSGAKSLARTLREDRIKRLKEERFHLVVLGEFNHGKTTFVNALLGGGVLPSGVTPTTAVIHRIQHADTPRAEAFTEGGETSNVPMEALEDYEVDGRALADNVQHIDVFHPSPLLAEGLILVDTPGVNDLNEARAEITYGYIPRSDAIIFLLDAGQILKESERSFIESKLVSGSRDKVFFVINKMDLLDEDEREEAISYATTNLAKLVNEPRVYAISAELALDGPREKSGLDDFMGELTTFLQEERGRVLLDNAIKAGLNTTQTLHTGIEIQKRALSMEKDELQRRLTSLEADLESSAERIAERQARIRESVAAVKAVVHTDIESFAKKFSGQVPSEIENSTPADIKKYFSGFIESRFKEFAEEEAEKVARRLEKIAEEAIAFVTDDAKARSARLAEVLGDDSTDLDLTVSTFAYDVGVFAVGAFGVTLMVLSNVMVGGALALAAPVLALVFRGRADKQIKERALEEAPKVIQQAAEEMSKAFDARIDEFSAKLIEFVTAANEEVTRSIAELVRAARDAGDEGSEARDELEAGAGMSLVRLASAKTWLESLRERLWKDDVPEAAQA